VLPKDTSQQLDLYLCAQDKGLQPQVILIAEQLRASYPQLKLRTHCAGLKNILNKARQTGAEKIVLIKRNQESTLTATLICGEDVAADLSIEQLIETLAE